MQFPIKLLVYENVRRIAFWRAIFCELFATAIFVFVGCGSISLHVNEDVPISSSTIIRIALAFGFAINILIKTFGPVSGCHINPAVSIAFLIVGKVSLVRAGLYTLAQIVGATLGAGILFAVLPAKYRTDLGGTILFNDLTPAQGFAAEAILTFILLLAISACLDERRIDHFKMKITNPLTIGLTISALHLVGIPFTGASMNPARSFGPAVITLHWSDHWVYWVGPITGACLSTIAYHLLISPQIKTAAKVDENKPSPTMKDHPPYLRRVSTIVGDNFQVVDVPLESYNYSAVVKMNSHN